MKRFVALILCLMLMGLVLPPLDTPAYTTNQRSKAIHIVYDDSASMIRDSNTYRDRWCQAKYALEVFAAMLEDRDIMQVYYMSDFDTSAGGSVNASARVSISGSESAQSRVSKIHNTVTSAASTPFDPVFKAYEDLKGSGEDEKWLVVLTDGEFNRLYGVSAENIDVNSFFSQFVSESDIKIMPLAIVDNASGIKADPDRGIYLEHAINDADILGKITSICNQIFNRNRLRFSNETRREFSFDVPMAEILVFAQGDNVRVNGIKGDGTHTPNSVVEVKYSETATTDTNYDVTQIKVARELTGAVASFRDIPKGSYSLDIAGAKTVEIYYKPDVNVDIRLYQNGEEIQAQNFIEGDYQIRFGIVNEEGEFFESSLFGKVDYEAAVTNGEDSFSVKSGDNITLKRGAYTITALAHFLDINTAENTITGRVLAEATPLELSIEHPNGELTVTNLNETGAFVLKVKNDGNPLTEEQWLNMPLPTIAADAKVDITGLKRGGEVSTFEFFIKQKDGDRFNTSTGDIKIEASAELEIDELAHTGKGDTTINIKDDIGFLDRLSDWMKKYGRQALIISLLALLILGYMPFIKKYLPKSLKKRPEIECKPTTPMPQPQPSNGRYEKIPSYTFLPFVAQRGTIRFTPRGVFGAPKLKIRGAGGGMMMIMNIKDYAGKQHIKFDGLAIEKGEKKPRYKSPSMSISATIEGMTYNCDPTVD